MSIDKDVLFRATKDKINEAVIGISKKIDLTHLLQEKYRESDDYPSFRQWVKEVLEDLLDAECGDDRLDMN